MSDVEERPRQLYVFKKETIHYIVLCRVAPYLVLNLPPEIVMCVRGGH